MKIDWKLTLYLSSLSVLMSPLAQAQFCGLTNGNLSGTYGYVASEAGTVVVPASGTDATGSGTAATIATNTFSTSNLGQLLGGIAAGNQLALGGVLMFDGAGDISAAATSGGSAVRVGTYTVNSDCSVSVSLTDPFGTATAVTQLAGVVLGRGAEIDLTSSAALGSSGAATSTTTSTTTTTTSGSGLSIKLVRALYQSGCLDSNLLGLYGFVLNPTSIQTTPAAEPSAVMGYLVFDGAGHIVPLSSMAGAPAAAFTALQYTGTYAVDSDCSGSMTIGKPAAATATTTAAASSSMTLNFVITPPTSAGGFAFAPAPALDLSFSTADAAGSGYALAQ